MLGRTLHLLQLSLSLFPLQATLRTQRTAFALKSPLSMSGLLKGSVSSFLKEGILLRGQLRSGASSPC